MGTGILDLGCQEMNLGLLPTHLVPILEVKQPRVTFPVWLRARAGMRDKWQLCEGTMR